jgi:predicted alpha/beta hydrolase
MSLSTCLFGYVPGKKMGKMGDLPKRLMNQCRRCCLSLNYCVEVESETVKTQCQQIDAPLVSITFSDDEMLSLTNMRELHALFEHENKSLKQVHPKKEGEKCIGLGNLGYFQP